MKTGFLTTKAISPSFEATVYLCFQLDFWRWPALGRTADIMVAPDSAAKAEKVLDDAGIEYHVSTLDVQR